MTLKLYQNFLKLKNLLQEWAFKLLKMFHNFSKSQLKRLLQVNCWLLIIQSGLSSSSSSSSSKTAWEEGRQEAGLFQRIGEFVGVHFAPHSDLLFFQIDLNIVHALQSDCEDTFEKTQQKRAERAVSVSVCLCVCV